MILQKEKPQNLMYHIHSFHVLDLKVFQTISFQTYTLFCRYASALMFHLELSMKSCLVASISILFIVMAHCMETLYLLMINLLKPKLFLVMELERIMLEEILKLWVNMSKLILVFKR